jgi:hypothetical protein
MTVGAHQLTLSHLFEHLPAIVPTPEVPEIPELLGGVQVVPLHCRVVKDEATVRAGPVFLEADVPGDELVVPPSGLLVTPLSVRLVVCGVVGASTWLTPGLIPVAVAVEVADRADLGATATSFRHESILGKIGRFAGLLC